MSTLKTQAEVGGFISLSSLSDGNPPIKQPIPLELSHIRTDGGTQIRSALHTLTVQDYASAMLEGNSFQPIVVFYDGCDYWLADGFHRLAAAKQIGGSSVLATILQGTRRDAVLFSVGANTRHGLPRTNADKRNAVETLLRDHEWSQWSDREIAKRSGVSSRKNRGLH